MSSEREQRMWISTAEAAELLSTSVGCFRSIEYKHGIRHIGNRHGTRWLWFRPDVEAVQHIRSECRIGVTGAIRVLVAIRNGRLPQDAAPTYDSFDRREDGGPV